MTDGHGGTPGRSIYRASLASRVKIIKVAQIKAAKMSGILWW